MERNSLAYTPNRSLRLLSLIAIAMMAGSPAVLSSESVQDFNISPQNLGAALNAFADKAGVQLSYPAGIADGVKSPGVSGRMSPQNALNKLLEGTGIDARSTRNGTMTLEKSGVTSREGTTSGAISLPKVKVIGKALYDSTDPYNPGYTRSRSSTASKTDTPIMKTPISVQVVTQEVMRDQQVVTVEDAVKNVSGVQRDWSYGNLYDNFIIRGFSTDQAGVYRNGFRLTTYTAETANVDSIDILKGPASMLYGRTNTGGLVNLVTKRPLSQAYYSLQQQFGSYDFYRTTADATGPLVSDSSLLYRVNLAYTGANSFRDFNFTDRFFVAPSLTWKLSDATEVNLNFEYKKNDFMLDHGIPAVGNRPAPVPISRNFGEPGARTHTDDYLVDFNWSHRFNDAWSVRQGFVAHQQDFFLETIVSPFLRPDNRTIGRFGNFTDYQRHQYGSYLDLTGQFDTYGVHHDVLVGGDWYEYGQESVGSFRPVADIDLFNPVYGTVDLSQQRAFLRSTPNSFFTETSEWFGLYFQDQITLWDKLHILGGGRHDWARAKSGFSEASLSSIEQTAVNTERFQPRVGIVYQPWEWFSVYGNYLESLGANNGRSAAGTPLKPEVGEQFEAGLKAEAFDGRLLATLAYFHIDKRNLLTSNVATTGDLFDQTSIGKARSQGVEFDLNGQLSDQLSLITTYAYTDARIVKDVGQILNADETAVIGITRGNQGKRLPNVPEHSGSLWAKYDFSGTAADGLSIGTGAYLASQRQGDNENTIQLPGYVRWDAMAAYRFKVGAARLTTQVNVNNILDKHYYKSTDVTDGNPRGRIAVAEPLTVMGSVRLEY